MPPAFRSSGRLDALAKFRRQQADGSFAKAREAREQRAAAVAAMAAAAAEAPAAAKKGPLAFVPDRAAWWRRGNNNNPPAAPVAPKSVGWEVDEIVPASTGSSFEPPAHRALHPPPAAKQHPVVAPGFVGSGDGLIEWKAAGPSVNPSVLIAREKVAAVREARLARANAARANAVPGALISINKVALGTRI